MNTFKSRLLEWFRKNKRKLPFRETKDAYAIWVSEIMLQQTRVNSMLPLYGNFMQRFPDISTLSRSTEDEVTAHWKGLGYYSRAINLHKGAKYITANNGGIFPDNLTEVLAIPGIGPYTARAILSISFNKPEAVLDGNVKRVLSRIFLFRENIGSGTSTKRLQVLANEFLNAEFPGEHNEAMMELGATLCGTDPQCLPCPLRGLCLAQAKGIEKELPVTSKKQANLEIKLNFILYEHHKKILMVRSRKRRFFKTIFTLPFIIEGENLTESYENPKLISDLFAEKNIYSYPKTARHTITNHHITLKLSKVELDSLPDILLNGDHEMKWIKPESIKDEFHSSIAGKLLKIISGQH